MSRLQIRMLLSLAAVVCIDSSAHAVGAPYDLVARYERAEGDKPLDVPIAAGAMIPDAAENARLSSIRVVFHRSALGLANTAVFLKV